MGKRGRPTQSPKTDVINIRATADDRRILKECCERLNVSQYDIVMGGINKIYNEINETLHE